MNEDELIEIEEFKLSILFMDGAILHILDERYILESLVNIYESGRPGIISVTNPYKGRKYAMDPNKIACMMLSVFYNEDSENNEHDNSNNDNNDNPVDNFWKQ